MVKSVALVVYGDKNSARNALQEDNYKGLADFLIKSGFTVESVLYHDSKQEEVAARLLKFDAVLVWVNPDQDGGDRRLLDSMLLDIAKKGVYVSTNPEVILRIGTKKVLFTTKDMDWGGDVKL